MIADIEEIGRKTVPRAEPPPPRTTSPWAGTLCLLALALAMPLVPHDELFLNAKPLVFLVVATCGALAVGIAGMRRAVLPRLGTPVDLAMFAFMATAIPAGLMARNTGITLYTSGLVLAQLLTYVLAVKVLRTPADVRRIATAILCAGVITSIAGLVGYRHFLADDAPAGARSAYLARPFFAHSYVGAQYLVMVLSGGIVLIVQGGLSRRAGVVVGAALLPIAAFVLVVGSRAAYLAVAAALIVLVVLRLRGAGGQARVVGRLLPRAFLIACFAGALFALAITAGLLPGALDHAFERVLAVFDPNASGNSFQRLEVWRNTLRMVADYPVFGVGPGGFGTAFPSYHASSSPVPHAHNQFLHVLAELGLVGFIALLFVVRYATRAVRESAVAVNGDDERRPLFHAGVAALAAGLTYFLFETPLVWPEASSLVMVLLVVATRGGRPPRESASRPGLAWFGMFALAAVLCVIGPTWVRHTRATTRIAEYVIARENARTAESAGRPDLARELRETALARLDEADAEFPWKPEAPALRADLLIKLERYEEALAATRMADARMPGSFRILTAQALMLMKLGRHAEALLPLRRALASYRGPEAVETYLMMGRTLAALGRHEEAWAVFLGLIDPSVRYDLIQPSILLDAARTLVALDRDLVEARALLKRYRRHALPAAELTVVEQVEHDLEVQLARAECAQEGDRAGRGHGS